MTVRPAEREDIEAIYALECASFACDRLSRRSLRRFLASSLRPVIAAKFGQALAGYTLVVMRRGGKSCRIYSLAVDPGFARRGVGAELLRASERYARAHGCEALRLEVRWDNKPAIALYEKLGFCRFGAYPSYYEDGAEALRFEKRLDDDAARAA